MPLYLRNSHLIAASLLMAGTLAAAGAANAADDKAAAADEHAGHDMGSMDHSGHSMDTERDAEGRRLYGVKHKMDEKLTKELRERVPLYQKYTDAEIALSMDMMGHEYAWYVSPDDVKGSQGILILTHGFREQGDKMFKAQVQPLGDIFPTAIGVGMAMMMSDHIQLALNDLEAAGAKEIVVVPVTSSATNELYRQWRYIFGKQDHAEFASVPHVRTNAEIHFIEPPGDNPLVAEIILDNAMELSQNPKKEFVIIAGHGPSSAEDNAAELKTLKKLAKVVKADGGFAGVEGMTLQDDAPPEIRAANVAKLRKTVSDATAKGYKVIVVTNLISARSIQAKMRSDLKELDYEFSAKGLATHPNFMKWMTESVREEFEKS